MLTCSPVDISTSISRGLGRLWMSCASAMRRLVSPLIAETVTMMSFPAFCAAMHFSATFSMRSTEPIEVPPYFCTINAM